MAITKQKKEDILKGLIEKFSKSKSVVFADYRGLDVAGISDLRNKLRESDAEMKVAKKTLIELAAKDQKIEDIENAAMEGPVAATFSYEDPLSGIKALFKFSKDNENLKLLGGIIDGKVVSPEIIEQYAKIPSREELLAKFIGSINSPVSGFVGILGNVLGGFVRTLSAYKDTLPAEEAKVEPITEKKKEEVAEVPKEEASTEPATEEASEVTETTTEEIKEETEEAPVDVEDTPAEPATEEGDKEEAA